MVQRGSVRFPGIPAAVPHGSGMAVVAGGAVRGGARAALHVLRAGSKAAAEPSRGAVAGLVRHPGRGDRGGRRGDGDRHHAPGQPRPGRRLGQRAGRRGSAQRDRPGRGSPPDLFGVRGPDHGPHPRARGHPGRDGILRQHGMRDRGRQGTEGQVRAAHAVPGRAAAVHGRATVRAGAVGLAVGRGTPHRSALLPRAAGSRPGAGPSQDAPDRRPAPRRGHLADQRAGPDAVGPAPPGC